MRGLGVETVADPTGKLGHLWAEGTDHEGRLRIRRREPRRPPETPYLLDAGLDLRPALRVGGDRAPDRLLLAHVRSARATAGAEPEQEASARYLLQCRGHGCEHTRMAIRDVQDEGPHRHVRYRNCDRGQRRPTLQHVRGAMHTTVEMIPGPDPREPGVSGGTRRVAHLGPTRAERIEEHIDLHSTQRYGLAHRAGHRSAAEHGPFVGRTASTGLGGRCEVVVEEGDDAVAGVDGAGLVVAAADEFAHDEEECAFVVVEE